jgi:two-component system, cell cycle sensor histidine kinase and response regulator CckA
MASILIVDDNVPSRAFLVSLLHHKGHHLLEAADGSEALGRVRVERPDLVISDILILPEIKVLHMSGYTDDAIMHHGVLESDIVLLKKPFTRESLTLKVREVIGTAEVHGISCSRGQ